MLLLKHMLVAVALYVSSTLLALGASTAAATAAPAHHGQAAGFYRTRLGDLEITSLFDGGASFEPDWLMADAPLKAEITEATGVNPHFLDSTVSVFLVNTGKHLILLDAGTGGWYGGPNFGRLLTNLRRAGYQPSQIDTVLITHLHADHVGGIATKAGLRVFSNAEVYVSKEDADFWLSPEIAAKAPQDARLFFEIARACTAPYIKAGRLHTFSGATDILEGVRAIPLPGHSPGHTVFEVRSGAQIFRDWGDVIHVQRVQLDHPEVTVAFDLDAKAAQTSRDSMLRSSAAGGILLAGPHMTFPAIGRLRKMGDVYRWDPVAFSDEWIER